MVPYFKVKYFSPEHIHRFVCQRFAVTSGTVQRKKGKADLLMQGESLTCSAATNQCSPQPAPFLEEHNRLCANVIWMLLPLCVRQGSWNLWLCFLLFKWEVHFSGPMQVILMILVLWCYVKHGVKDAWQECWEGKRIWCTASSHHRLLS